MAQNLAVAAIVAAAFAWVAWNILLPEAARRRLRRLTGRADPPRRDCCGCAGCGSGGTPTAPR
jgi:hypothetical protein